MVRKSRGGLTRNYRIRKNKRGWNEWGFLTLDEHKPGSLIIGNLDQQRTFLFLALSHREGLFDCFAVAQNSRLVLGQRDPLTVVRGEEQGEVNWKRFGCH